MGEAAFVASIVIVAIALLAALLWAATRTERGDGAAREANQGEFVSRGEHWSLIASCGIGAWIWHVSAGTIEWDAGMFSLFDVPAGQAPRDLAQFVALLTPDHRARISAALTALSTTGGLLDAECRLAHTNRTLCMLAMRADLEDGQMVRVIGICQDVSRRAELEERYTEHARVAAFFAAVGAALTEKATLEATLGKCATALIQELDVAVCRIWTVDDAGTTLELKASAGLNGELDLGPRRIPVDHFTNGLMDDHGAAGHDALHGFGGYPLLVDDRLVGVLTIFSRTSLSHTTISALAVVAKQLALGIEHRRGDVISYVAHDFTKLLTAIGVCIDLLKSSLPTGRLERHYVDDIETAATRAADLTRLLQTVSHKTPR